MHRVILISFSLLLFSHRVSIAQISAQYYIGYEGQYMSIHAIKDNGAITNISISDNDKSRRTMSITEFERDQIVMRSSLNFGDTLIQPMYAEFDQNGNLFIAGTVELPDQNYEDAFIIKLNGNYEISWMRAFGREYAEYPYSMGIDDKGSIYLHLNSSFSTGLSQNCTIKFLADGQLAWSFHYKDTGIWGRSSTDQNGNTLVQNVFDFYLIDSEGSVSHSFERNFNNSSTVTHYRTAIPIFHKQEIITVFNGKLGNLPISKLEVHVPNGKLVAESPVYPNMILENILPLNESFVAWGSKRHKGAWIPVTVVFDKVDQINYKISRMHSYSPGKNPVRLFSTLLDWGDYNETQNIFVFQSNLFGSFTDTMKTALIVTGNDLLTDCSESIPVRDTIQPFQFRIRGTSLNRSVIDFNPYSISPANSQSPIFVIEEDCFDCNSSNFPDETFTLCINDSLQIGKAINFGDYLWNTGATEANIVIYEPGDYTQIIYSPCDTDTVIYSIKNAKEVEVSYTIEPLNAQVYDPVNLSYSSSDFCYWLIENDTIYSKVYIASFEANGEYDICLKCLSIDNCSDEFKATVKVETYSFFVPEIFSPNGDGLNDEFAPVGLGIDKYEMKIYNRWGQEVFNGSHAWDGMLHGNPCPLGKYTVLIQYWDQEGRTDFYRSEIRLAR